MSKFSLFLFCLISCSVFADTHYPASDWQDAPDPFASPFATPGGELIFSGNNPPKSLNYYLDSNTGTAMVFGLLYQSLLATHSITSEYVPSLAKKWTISDDKKTFTFEIDERAKWSDGSPVTAADVKATFDAVMHPMSMTSQFKVRLARFSSPEIIDERTIRFVTDESHWINLTTVSSLYILPKKLLDKFEDFNKLNFKLDIVSGPYKIHELKEGISLTLKRRADYWGFATPSGKGLYNFDTILIRYFMDNNNAFEAFKKGLLDVYPVFSARVWFKEATGDKFTKNWIVKQNVCNHEPIGFQGFAMNMRRPPYDDVRVRKALAYLFDRERVVRTLMYDAYLQHNSYFQDLYDSKIKCPNQTFEYSPGKAYELLKEAGFAINKESGKMERNGEPLVVNMLTRDVSSNTFLALYKDALNKLGIMINISQKDFASWMREMDTYNFDITVAAWGGTIFRDPESMWSGEQADVKNGVNITGYKSKKVDELIEKQKTCFSITERNELLRELDAELTSDVPYILTWYINSTRLLYWNKFGTPDTVLGKFGDEYSIPAYWWYDADSANELENAQKNNLSLPNRPEQINFDEITKD